MTSKTFEPKYFLLEAVQQELGGALFESITKTARTYEEAVELYTEASRILEFLKSMFISKPINMLKDAALKAEKAGIDSVIRWIEKKKAEAEELAPEVKKSMAQRVATMLANKHAEYEEAFGSRRKASWAIFGAFLAFWAPGFGIPLMAVVLVVLQALVRIYRKNPEAKITKELIMDELEQELAA